MLDFRPWRVSGKRKRVTSLVTISVPAEMSPEQARREIRTLITHQTNYAAEPDQIKAIKVRPLPRGGVR